MGSGCTTALCGLKIFFKRRAGVLYRYRFTGESVETGEKDCEGDGAVSSLQAFPRAWGVGDSRPRLNRCQNALDFPTLETYADQAVPALGPPSARPPPASPPRIICTLRTQEPRFVESHICQNRADVGHPSFVTDQAVRNTG